MIRECYINAEVVGTDFSDSTLHYRLVQHLQSFIIFFLFIKTSNYGYVRDMCVSVCAERSEQKICLLIYIYIYIYIYRVDHLK